MSVARNIAAMVVCAAGATTAVAFAATPASAADCSVSTRNVDNGSVAVLPNKAYKSGPYAACGTVKTYPVTSTAYLQCWKKNSYGNWWAYVRISSTQTYGWQSESNFSYLEFSGYHLCEP